jgi:hypothetical protein
MQTLRRLLVPLVALAVLVWVVHWLMSKREVQFRLGPGLELVASDGVDGFLVREAEGVWRLYDARSRGPQDGVEISSVVGWPALTADGGAFAMQADELVRLPRVGSDAAALRVPAPGASLVGVADGHRAVLAAAPADGGRGLLILADGAGNDGDGGPHLLPLHDAAGPARLPAGASAQDIVCAAGGPALAVRTPQGWEAWRWDESGAARRSLAEGCDRPGALFRPDGRALIVPGKVDGLWTLSLADGQMGLMAEGNLGISRRVPPSAAFRDTEQNTRLVAPGWNLDGWLQIYQTHLFGGGRWGVSISYTHHYGVALSHDGRFMAYCQAQFDEDGGEPFEEELFVLDFDQAVSTVSVGSRRGGVPWQGPHFVGSGASLVYLADGEVLRIELLPPASGAKEN